MKNKITQKEIAQKLGVSQPMVSMVLNKKRRLSLKKLIELYEIIKPNKSLEEFIKEYAEIK